MGLYIALIMFKKLQDNKGSNPKQTCTRKKNRKIVLDTPARTSILSARTSDFSCRLLSCFLRLLRASTSFVVPCLVQGRLQDTFGASPCLDQCIPCEPHLCPSLNNHYGTSKHLLCFTHNTFTFGRLGTCSNNLQYFDLLKNGVQSNLFFE